MSAGSFSRIETGINRVDRAYSGPSCLKHSPLDKGNLTNDNGDGDGNENGKNSPGLEWQNSTENNNFARVFPFLYIDLPSLHDYDVKLSNFTFDRGRRHKTTILFFFL